MLKLRHVVLALAILLAMLGDSWGRSRLHHPPAQQTQSAQQPATTDQRGSEQSPAFVKIIPTPKTDAETAQEAAEREERGNSDKWLIRWTAAVAAFTFILAAVGAWQGIQLKRSVDLARQEFIATHRPKIIVYGMEVSLPGETDKPRQVHFRYVSAGDTDASVTSIESRIYYSKGMVVSAGLELRRHDVIKQPISVRSGANGYAITPEGAGFINLVRSGKDGVVFCVGVIVYRDSNGIERRTGFCRWFDGQSERWKKLEDDDYEYSY